VAPTRSLYQRQLTESLWPAVDEGPLRLRTIGGLLDEAAQDSPGATALVEVRVDGEVGRRWTYAQLRHTARALAQRLLRRHPPRSRIAIWAHNIPEWTLLEFAAAYAGLTLVTLNPSFQKREVRYVLEKSQATAIYLVPVCRGNPIAAIAGELRQELPRIDAVIDLGDHDALFGGPAAEAPFPEVQPRDPAQIQFTSGSTGQPKGALLHHAGLIENARLHASRGGMRAGDVVMNTMPMFHTGGCGVLTLGPIAQRAAIVLFAQYDPAVILRVIEAERISCAFGVPTMITGLLEAQASARRDLSSVRAIIAGGAMVAPELVRRAQAAFGASFQIIYGQTETSPVLTMVWPDDSIEDLTESVGQPIPQVELSIRDVAANTVQPLDTVGEICARSPMNMLGYFGDDEATARAVDGEGWLHTGDLGTLDARGYLRVTGRVKEMIIRGGENLFPAEIENAMLEHPALAEVAVVGLPDPRLGEIVGCFMRPAGPQRPHRAELVAFCRERLSPQKTPAVWVYVEDWPLTGSGKIRKFMLQNQYREGRFEHSRF
jgi:fatty-acyl-CoA synthase